MRRRRAPRRGSGSAPWRRPCCWSSDAAQALIGSQPRRRGAGAAAAACRAACNPIDDKRGTIDYRTKVAGVLPKRTAAIAAERAEKERTPWPRCTSPPPSTASRPSSCAIRTRRCWTRCATRSASPAPRKAAAPAIAAPAPSRWTAGWSVPASCWRPRPRASEIDTIEGMAKGDELHPLQQKFLEQAALQCGICTPGVLMAAKALLERNPDPTENRGPLLARRQPLPLHRLRQDRPCRAGNRRRDEEGRLMDDRSPTPSSTTSGSASAPSARTAPTRSPAAPPTAPTRSMPGMIWGKVLRSPHRACAHRVDRHLEGGEAAGREGGRHREGRRRISRSTSR